VGNGYVLTLGGKRIYMSGDTGDIPETRALQNIDVAFLCVNVPFTMTVNQAAAVTRAFAPKVVYPYHFHNQDGTYSNLTSLKSLVGYDLPIEVRIRKWY
jgi:L-ascorbate metabolism protein UlaG (beta-lactamase superfamily)